MIEPKTLAGFLDWLPQKALLKENLILKIKQVLLQHGFLPIETPHLEYAQTLMGEAEGENKKLIYHFEDHGQRKIALRFDHTVPLARFVSQHKNELSFPFKRYVVGNVFRGESPQAGRYREFTQFDFDCIGSNSIHADVEILLIIAQTLSAIGVQHFEIHFNHRLFFEALAQSLGVQDGLKEILRAVDKFEKIGPEGVKKELTQKLTPEQSESILKFIALPTENFSQFQDQIQQNYPIHLFEKPLKEVTSVLEIFHPLLPKEHLKLNLKIARGLDYYTGMVFETFLTHQKLENKQFPPLGSVCSGGRYDNLVSSFSKDLLPGVGASIGLDRLLAYLEGENQTLVEASPLLYLGLLDTANFGFAEQLAKDLRSFSLRVEVSFQEEKIKRHFAQANKKNAHYLIAIGKEEVELGTFTLANLKTGEKIQALKRKDLKSVILRASPSKED